MFENLEFELEIRGYSPRTIASYVMFNEKFLKFVQKDPRKVNNQDVKNYMCSKYKIDKAYIIGFSQGGSHTYVTGIKNPDVFEGIICFGAIMPDPQKFSWFLSEENIENGSNLKVFIAHGKSDPYPYKNAIKARRKLQKYKYDVEQHLFDGGHMIDPTTFLKALNWMGIQ